MEIKEIKDPSFLENLSIKELEDLSNDIREFMLDNVSKNGGHLGGNLGIVELTVAMHKYFNHGEKFIFDVGHQCYTHKILTGRAKDFDKLRKKDGIAGFPTRSESSYDTWEVAHSSTSLACLAGLTESNISAVALIGDGALTGGEALEALEYLSTINKKAIIILNDNNFSISKNVGLIQKMLDRIRSSSGYTNFAEKHRGNYKLKSIKNFFKRAFYKPTLFDQMGFKYYGPIDGYNFKELFKYFEYANSQNRPVVLHVITKKGKGFKPAEDDKIGKWHCVGPFDRNTGELLGQNNEMISFSKVAANYLSDFYKKHDNLKVVMPAMTYSSNMVELKDIMGKNYIDTGITEQFATSFSASLALGDNYVCLPVYSSFLQRAYDQIHQDISLQNVHVVMMVDKAGIVPDNGKTHQGIFDISYLSTIPNIKVVAPKDAKELYEFFDYAFLKYDGPIAIHVSNSMTKKIEGLEIETSNIKEEWTYENKLDNPKGYLVTYSVLVDYIKDICKELNIEVINARFIKPMDEVCLKEIAKENKPIMVYEEAPSQTSLYSKIVTFYNQNSILNKVYPFGFPLEFIHIGSTEELRKEYKLDKESIKERISEIICD